MGWALRRHLEVVRGVLGGGEEVYVCVLYEGAFGIIGEWWVVDGGVSARILSRGRARRWEEVWIGDRG